MELHLLVLCLNLAGNHTDDAQRFAIEYHQQHPEHTQGCKAEIQGQIHIYIVYFLKRKQGWVYFKWEITRRSQNCRLDWKL